MAAAPTSARRYPCAGENRACERPSSALQPVEFPGVFRGRELTRKDRRLSSGLVPLDNLIAGGIVRGRISEITGPTGSGKTALAACFIASATRHGETTAWLDLPGAFDPASVEAAGADLARILWVGFDGKSLAWDAALAGRFRCALPEKRKDPLKAAELILDAGGFALAVIDFGAMRYPLSQHAALRLARAAERSGAAVLALAARRMCGTFAALTLSLGPARARFSRLAAGAPALFDGLRIGAIVARNKFGAFGHRAELCALAGDADAGAGIFTGLTLLAPLPPEAEAACASLRRGAPNGAAR